MRDPGLFISVDMTVPVLLGDSVFTETTFVKYRVSVGTRKRTSKNGDVSRCIDCYFYMEFWIKHAGPISRAYGKPDSLFRVKFCHILRVYLGKKSVMYVQNMFIWTQ